MKKAFLWFMVGDAFVLPLILYQHGLGIYRGPLMAGTALSIFMGFKATDGALHSERQSERVFARCLVILMIALAVAGIIVQFWPRIAALAG